MSRSRPPACRLYLVVKPGEDFTMLADQISQAVADGADIAAMLLPEMAGANADSQKLITKAQDLGIAVLIKDDANLAKALGADGVEVADLEAYKSARAILGPDGLIGARCGASRHDAMALGEAGADYVALAPELIDWWAGLFEPACVCDQPVSLANAPEIIAAGADFIQTENLIDASGLTKLIAGNKP